MMRHRRSVNGPVRSRRPARGACAAADPAPRSAFGWRQQIAANAAILKPLAENRQILLEHDSAVRAFWTRLLPLLSPPPNPPKPRIGFKP
jgi:hypothetical protein